MAPARPEGQANREVPPPREPPREEQAGYVDAGDQEQHGHRPQQDPQAAPGVPHHLVLEGDHAHAPAPVLAARAAVIARVLLLQAAPHRVHLRPRRREGDPGGETRDHAQAVGRTVGPLLRGQGQGDPQVGAPAEAEARVGKLEPGRHDPHHDAAPAVEVNRVPHHGLIGTEPPPPQGVAQQDDRVRPGLLLLRP